MEGHGRYPLVTFLSGFDIENLLDATMKLDQGCKALYV